MPSFKHAWKNHEMSDMDVILALPGEQQQHLTSFPGHQIILSTSPFMRAAVSCMCIELGQTNLLLQKSSGL